MVQNRVWRCACAAVLPLGVAAVVSAATDPTDRPWMRLETNNFTLYGEIPEQRLVLIAVRLEAFRAALEALHPGSRASPRETSIYVFRSAESGWPYTPAAATGGHRLGVAQRFDVPNYVTIAAPEDDTPLEILLHSYAHQFVDDNFPRLPLTIAEGLAEFYSGFRVTPEGSFIGLVNSEHVRRMRGQPVLPLSVQFAVEPGASLFAQRDGREAFVSGSWALVHYLVSGSGPARARLPEFLQALQRGISPAEATRATFGIPIEDLEKRVSDYVRGDRFLPLRVTSGDTIGTAAEREPPRRLGKDEVLTALGEILGHAGDGRASEAESYFDAALRLNPRQAKALAGSGYLRYSRGRYDEAIDLFERSIAIEPDAMSCYLLARSLLKINAATGESEQAAADAPDLPDATSTPDWLARSRRLLAQAIELRPEFAAPYLTLAGTHLLPDGDPNIGVPLLINAQGMLPGRTDIAGSLVYLLLRQGDHIRALKVIEQSLANSGDEKTLEQARAAVAAFETNLATKQNAYRRGRSGPRDPAAEDEMRERYVRDLEAALAATDDPEIRARIEEMLRGASRAMSTEAFNEAVTQFNEAIELANKRDYRGAIALLEDLLSRLESYDVPSEPDRLEPTLKDRVIEMLERFRADAARLQQPMQ